MDIHEYQAKKILSDFGVTIPRGGIVYSPENAENKAREIGGSRWVVKAQIHSGARGKAGGIIVCDSPLEVAQATDKLLGKKLVTNQTGPEGKIVNRIYIEEATDIERELYLGLVFDRSSESIMVVASTEGGMSVEEISKEKPESIIRSKIEVAVGMPSTIATQVLIPASAASIAESAAKAGGTNKIDASAPVSLTASLTVLNTGKFRCIEPPFPGVTPPTTLEPYLIISSA